MNLFKIKDKFIIVILSFSVLGCGCPGVGHDKSGIYKVDIKSYDTTRMYNVYAVFSEYNNKSFNKVPIASNLIRNVDTLEIHFTFEALGERIAVTRGFSLINTAFACSPIGDAFTLKYKIDSVIITSDTIYNGIEKGQSLNALFFKPTQNGNIDDIVTELNGEGALSSSYYFNFNVATDKKSGIYTDNELFIKIYKSNGEIVEGSTGKFKWY